MPTFDVPTNDGSVRVSASSPEEAAVLVGKGEGLLLQAPPAQTGANQAIPLRQAPDVQRASSAQVPVDRFGQPLPTRNWENVPRTDMEPGLQDVPLFLPIAAATQRAVLQHPAVLPGTLGAIAGPPGVFAGEALRQTLLPSSQQVSTPISGDNPLLQPIERALKAPGILPTMVTGAMMPMVTQASGIVPALARTGAGTAAATTAEIGRKAMAGEPITPSNVATDAALNATMQGIPEVVPEVIRFAGRHVKGGQQLLKQEAGRRAEGLGQQAFAPMPEQEIANQFNLVKASGMQLKPEALRDYLKNLSSEDQQTLVREIKHIASGPDADAALGQKLAGVVQNVMRGHYAPGVDIGELQQLRSQLRKRIDRVSESAKQDLLSDFKDAVDTAIDSGQVIGSGPNMVPLLHQARKNYAVARTADDLSSLVAKHSTNLEDLSGKTFNLASFQKELDTKTSRLAASVDAGLARNPEAKARLDAWVKETSKLYPRIEIPEMGGILGVGQRILAAGMMSDAFRGMLTKFLVDNKGSVTANQLAILDTMLSHESLMAGRQPVAQQ